MALNEDQLSEMEMKYIVFKIQDTDTYLTTEEFELLDDLCAKINRVRLNEGRELNHYLVINTDEPYANDVMNIMKRHGHWGYTG